MNNNYYYLILVIILFLVIFDKIFKLNENFIGGRGRIGGRKDTRIHRNSSNQNTQRKIPIWSIVVIAILGFGVLCLFINMLMT